MIINIFLPSNVLMLVMDFNHDSTCVFEGREKLQMKKIFLRGPNLWPEMCDNKNKLNKINKLMNKWKKNQRQKEDVQFWGLGFKTSHIVM